MMLWLTGGRGQNFVWGQVAIFKTKVFAQHSLLLCLAKLLSSKKLHTLLLAAKLLPRDHYYSIYCTGTLFHNSHKGQY